MSCCLRVWLLIRRHLSDDCGLSQSLNGLVGTSPLPGALVHPNNEAKCPVSPWKMLVYIPSILTFTAATWGAALQASQLTINSAWMCKSRRTTTNKETGVKRVWECAHTHTHTHTYTLQLYTWTQCKGSRTKWPSPSSSPEGGGEELSPLQPEGPAFNQPAPSEKSKSQP